MKFGAGLKEGYSYIAAGWNSVNLGGLAAFVRYKPTSNDLVLTSKDSDHYRFSLPDRDLLLVRNYHEMSAYSPVGESWDEVSYLGTSSGLVKDVGLDYCMLNYTTFMGKEATSPNARSKNHRVDDGITWLSDSGGYQLVTQRVDFVDPVKLAHWYNDNVDLGMSLDIPVYREDLRKRASLAQKSNNDIMLDNLSKNVELLNVIHGDSTDLGTFYECLDLVHDDRIRRLSVSDIYFGTVVDAVYKTTSLLEYMDREYNHHYKHVHLLGIFNIKVLLPLLYIFRNRFPHIHFTSDSTTYLQHSLNNSFMAQAAVDKPLVAHKIGYSAHPNYKASSPFRTLPCSCPVCSQLKYTDLFSYNRGFIVYFLMLHNALEMARYTRKMNQLAKELSISDYRALCSSHITNNRAVQKLETKATFDFVENYLNHGMEYAQKKASHWMSQNDLLWGQAKPSPILSDGVEKPEEIIDTTDFEYQEKVIERYENGFKIEELGKKKRKNRTKHSRPKKRLLNKSVNRNKKTLSLTAKKPPKKK